MKSFFSHIALLCCFAASALAQQAIRPVQAKHGMVVSAHALASEAGVEIMKKGGNAIDAAIATGLALAVVQPGAGNIGGGGFMVVVMKDGRSFAFDFREKAPAAARKDMYLDANGKYIKNSNHEGYRAVGVPGTVAGFDLALKKLGKKSWKDLTRPAIRLAEEGFRLSHAMGADFKNMKRDFQRYPSTAKIFFKNDTLPYGEGDVWRQPDLAISLKRLQQQGRDGFYKGATARLIAQDMKRNGGLITEQDLAEYQAVERVPVRGTYRGYDIVSMPPPSSGGVALIEMLNILEGYDLKSFGHNSTASLHLLAEAMRIAYRDRAEFLGDPDFAHSIPVAKLTSKEYAEELRRSIDRQHAAKSSLGRLAGWSESTETTHYSVVDSEGNSAAVTYTLEYWYGSRIVAQGTAQFLVIAGNREDATVILTQARARGMTLPVLGGDGLEGIEAAGALAEGVFVTAAYLAGLETPENQRFVRSYGARYPEAGAPNQPAAASYDAVYLLRDVIRARGATRRGIHEGLAVLGDELPPHQGVTGVLAFDGRGDLARMPVLISVIRNGVVSLAEQK